MLSFIHDTETIKKNGRNRKFALYKCSCGNTVIKNKDNVRYKIVQSCGKCLTKELIPLPNSINGIKVISDLGMNDESPRKRIAKFKCFCGEEFTAKVNAVGSGHKYSCGCARGMSNKSHGLSGHPLYRKWSGMITRTTNKKENCFARYGGRGIIVCDEWRYDFVAFYNWAIDNGWEEGLTIDRINIDGNYEPSNCQWISMIDNTLKDRKSTFLKKNKQGEICDLYNNSMLTVTEIAEFFATYKELISNILKDNGIKIEHRRKRKCYLQ